MTEHPSKSTYTVVHVDIDESPHVYGTFATRDAAMRFRDKIQRDLDAVADVAGGGVGHLHVARVQRKDEWSA